MELLGLAVGFSIASMMVAVGAIVVAGVCWSKVVGLQNSTHQIQYVPLEDELGKPIEGDNLVKNAMAAMGLEEDYER